MYDDIDSVEDGDRCSCCGRLLELDKVVDGITLCDDCNILMQEMYGEDDTFNTEEG